MVGSDYAQETSTFTSEENVFITSHTDAVIVQAQHTSKKLSTFA